MDIFCIPVSMFFGKQPQLIFKKKTGLLSIMGFFNIGLNIGLNIPFIMKWGAFGAAWATFLAGLISGSITFFIAQYYYNIKWEYRKIVQVFVVFFGSTILLILMRKFSVGYMPRLFTKVVIVGGYIYLGTIFQIITKENLDLVKRSFSLKSFKGIKNEI